MRQGCTKRPWTQSEATWVGSMSHVFAVHFFTAIFNWSIATLWWCRSCCWWAHLQLWGLICLCSDLNPRKWECCSEVSQQSMQFWVTVKSVMETQPSGYIGRMSFSHQASEHGNIVGTGKPGRVVVIVGNQGDGHWGQLRFKMMM